VGEGVCKRGKKTVPFFGSKGDAIAWHEQWLLDRRAGRKPRLRDVEYSESVEHAGLAVRAAGLRLWLQAGRRGRGTGYQGVTEKTVTCDGESAAICVAKHDGEYLGSFGTAIEAAAAFAEHHARHGLTLPDGVPSTASPDELKARQQPPPAHLVDDPAPPNGAAAASTDSLGGSDGGGAASGKSKRKREEPKPERPTRPPAAHFEREEARQVEALRRRVSKEILSKVQLADGGDGLLDSSLYPPQADALAADVESGAARAIAALAAEEEHTDARADEANEADEAAVAAVAAVAAESDAESDAESVD